MLNSSKIDKILDVLPIITLDFLIFGYVFLRTLHQNFLQDKCDMYLSLTGALEDLPPPPPEPAEYSNQCPAPNFPPPPDDLPPPPSPVSSSYSELRRATYQPNYQPEYGTYGPSSQVYLQDNFILTNSDQADGSGLAALSNEVLHTKSWHY